MAKRFPQRTADHEREDRSRRYFESQLPAGWTNHKPDHDYGIDLQVDIFENGLATGLELIVQLKSSAGASTGDAELVELRTSTYNYLMERLEVAMLAKFIDPEREAYWILLRDVPHPADGQKTFTIRIPKTNRLSTINWNGILDLVRRVSDVKRAAARAARLAAGNLHR